MTLKQAEIAEFDEEEPIDMQQGPTDEELGKTYGYEGKFKVGDRVRVIKSMTIWSVKQYAQKGFDPINYTGTVQSLQLYGRKYKSLCSAITPVKVEFLPDNIGIPTGMFDRKWSAHFAAEELELIE